MKKLLLLLLLIPILFLSCSKSEGEEPSPSHYNKLNGRWYSVDPVFPDGEELCIGLSSWYSMAKLYHSYGVSIGKSNLPIFEDTRFVLRAGKIKFIPSELTLPLPQYKGYVDYRIELNSPPACDTLYIKTDKYVRFERE